MQWGNVYRGSAGSQLHEGGWAALGNNFRKNTSDQNQFSWALLSFTTMLTFENSFVSSSVQKLLPQLTQNVPLNTLLLELHIIYEESPSTKQTRAHKQALCILPHKGQRREWGEKAVKTPAQWAAVNGTPHWGGFMAPGLHVYYFIGAIHEICCNEGSNIF